jgi:hypothetical protein
MTFVESNRHTLYNPVYKYSMKMQDYTSFTTEKCCIMTITHNDKYEGSNKWYDEMSTTDVASCC